MSPPTAETDRESVLQAHHAYLNAMVDGDAQSVDDLLDAGFTLTHMTGYVQPKAEWLAEMRAGQFVYHSIDEVDMALDLDGDTAHLTVRTMTDATVYGSRAGWRLLLTTDYARRGTRWIPVRTIATAW
ncbi:nuclear transport factor 2 family protein [Streptomyces sp. NPDC047725]|uniref:nuclear transport factor 2 family protein n=1 Tax=Streptomyces sp. NPDC047725 TaxID=3365487 RepID=UPI0037159AC2